MADKLYKLIFEKDDGTTSEVQFTAPQGPQGPNGTDGIGISSITKTKTNGRVDTYTITYTDETTSTFTVTNGANGTSVTIASIGEVIDETTEEVIGHTVNFSDGKTITIMNGIDGKDGEKGDKGDKGDAGADGKDGTNGKDGANGTNGNDGVSATHSWNGTVLTITSASGTSSADLKGDKGDQGIQGEQGIQGVQGEQGEKGEKGDKGDTGAKGDKGDTGAKGDKGDTYTLTPADKTEIAEQAVELIDGVPSYWLSALEEGAKEINTALCTAGRNKSAFLFYTDAHWGYGSGMSPKLLRYLGKHTGINKTIFGGDFGNTYENPDTGKTMDDWADVMREWKLAVRDIPNHHSVVGNHDKEVEAFNTDKSLYGFLFAPEETNDIVRGGDFFYYIDDVNEKTRYFYLNTGLCDFSDEQCAFLVEGLTSVPSGWHIIAVSHIWFVYNSTSTPTEGSVPTNIQKVLDLFDAYNGRTAGSVTIDSEAVSYDFSACEGYVEFCIGGHTHVDYSFVTTGGIPVIICCTDSRHLRGSGYSFTFGTTTESAVSCIIADYDAKKISVIRVGRGTSHEVPINRKEPVKYTNVLSIATDADGNIYNGVGWQADREISSSSHAERDSSSGFDLTGYINVHFGDIIRLKNITMPDATDRSNMVYFYNADKSWGGNSSINPSKTQAEPVFENGNLVQFKWYLNYNEEDGGYIRINAAEIDETSIITINEPIE